MSQYTMKYNPLAEAWMQFVSIRQALEEYSDKLQRMAKDSQKGLENEAVCMALYSKLLQVRAEEINQASSSLNKINSAYYDAELYSYERITEFDSPKIHDMILHGLPLNLLKIFGIYRRFRIWSLFGRSKRPDWSKLRAPIDWHYFLPVFPILIGGRRILPAEFIIGRLRRKKGGQQGTEGAPGQTGAGGDVNETGDAAGAAEVAHGAGVTALPEEDFAASEEAVEAETGRAEMAVDVSDFTYTENAVEAEAALAGAALAGAAIGVTGSSFGGGGYSGGGGSYGGEAGGETAPASSEIEEPVIASGDSEPTPDLRNAVAPAVASPVMAETSKVDSPAVSTDESYDINAAASDLPNPSGTGLKTDSGLAAPVIGVAAAGSIAASGLGLSNKLGGGNSTDAGLTEQVEPPVVTAKEATGNFSGNLKGEYIVIGTALSLAFAGASLKAGMSANKNAAKPDDRFRIGYGTSAILSGGPIQERS